MQERRFLTAENIDEAVSFCCQNTPNAAEPDQHRKIAEVATQYLKEDMEKHRDQLPMGCSARDYRNFVDGAIYRTDARIREEHKDQACGFGFIAIIGLISSLLSIWRFLRDWLNRP